MKTAEAKFPTPEAVAEAIHDVVDECAKFDLILACFPHDTSAPGDCAAFGFTGGTAGEDAAHCSGFDADYVAFSAAFELPAADYDPETGDYVDPVARDYLPVARLMIDSAKAAYEAARGPE